MPTYTSANRIALFLTTLLPVLAAPVQDFTVLPNKYIVTLKQENVDVENHLSWVSNIHSRSLARRSTAGVEHTVNIGAFHAYTGEFDDETITLIKGDPSVAFVEQDQEFLAVNLKSFEVRTREEFEQGKREQSEKRALITQTDAPWGIASLSVPQLPNGNWENQTYVYDSSAGERVVAYVFDTGVMVENTEFEGRAFKGFTPWDEEFVDRFGHGSHVAGTIASKTFGVAKKAQIIDVKVARGVGYATVASILAGLDWAVQNATNSPWGPAKSVINISLALRPSDTLNQGFAAAFAAGVLTVAGAANDGADASGKSPASEPTVITVGAVNWQKSVTSWSNFGPLVDIFAPGDRINSIWNEEGAISTVDGTSMSSPHVAGLVAYLKAKEGDLDTPEKTTARVLGTARRGVITNVPANTVNLLAYHGAGEF